MSDEDKNKHSLASRERIVKFFPHEWKIFYETFEINE